MNAMTEMSKYRHEKVLFVNNEKAGLKAIIAVHNTNLGPPSAAAVCSPTHPTMMLCSTFCVCPVVCPTRTQLPVCPTAAVRALSSLTPP